MKKSSYLDFLNYLLPGEKVLTLGCGEGKEAFELAKGAGEVYGVDINPEKIEKAKQIFQKGNLHFLAGDALKLPFVESFFGGIYCRWLLHLLPLENAVKEMERVLKKGGILYLLVLRDMTELTTGKNRNFYSAERIISALSGFELLKKEEGVKEEWSGKEIHRHRVLKLVLRKN